MFTTAAGLGRLSSSDSGINITDEEIVEVFGWKTADASRP
jgi:hypothetical protein